MAIALPRQDRERAKTRDAPTRPITPLLGPTCFRLANDGRAALKTGLHAQRGECSPQIEGVKQCAHIQLFFGNNHVSQKQMLQLPLRDEVPSFIANYEKLNGNMFEASLCLFSGCPDV